MKTFIEQRYDVALRAYHLKIRTAARHNRNNLPGFDVEDIEQEFREVLWRVVESYDPNNGAKFNTYFWQCIRNRIADLIKRAHAEKRKSEWFEFETNLSPDAVSEVVRSLEEGSWQGVERMNPEEWYLLRETVIERAQKLRLIA